MNSTVNEAEIWSRTIQPESGSFPVAAAQEFLRLRLSDADDRRVRELSTKANSGDLSAEETQELDYYLNVGRALELLKAKARASLRAAAC